MNNIDFIASNKALQAVKSAFEKDLAGNSYIIEGDPDTVTEALRLLGAYAVCDSHGCMKCSTCHQVMSGVYPDVKYYPNQLREKNKDNVLVEDAADLVRESSYAPAYGKRKAFLVNATKSVPSTLWQNKLLKVLEDTPDNNYIFIGTDNASSLLDTVRSRCNLVRLANTDADIMAQALSSDKVSPKRASCAALLSEGNLAKAKAYAANSYCEDTADFVIGMLCGMTKTSVSVSYVAELTKRKDKIEDVLRFMEYFFSQSAYDGEILLLKGLKDDIIKVRRVYSAEAAAKCVQLVENATLRLTHKGNFNVVIDNLILKILEVRYRYA